MIGPLSSSSKILRIKIRKEQTLLKSKPVQHRSQLLKCKSTETYRVPRLQPHSFGTEAMRWPVSEMDCCTVFEISITKAY
jgi:hypothetical protein